MFFTHINPFFYNSAFMIRTHKLRRSFPPTPSCDFTPFKTKTNLCKRSKRTFAFTRLLPGSLTIEAALVLPIFLFAIMSILSFTDILRLQIKADNALSQTAKELAVYAYVTHSNDQDSSGTPQGNEASSFISGLALSETYVRSRVNKELSSDYISSSPMDGGMSFLGSRFMNDEKIDLCLTYKVTPFFALSPRSGFLTGSHAVARGFTGYDGFVSEIVKEEEETVFITPSGSAYHKSRGCPYLDLSIGRVSKAETPSYRNNEGERYLPCPICAARSASDVVYITGYGNRYHSDLLCSGLKRTVEAVPISKVGGRHACPKCCH